MAMDQTLGEDIDAIVLCLPGHKYGEDTWEGCSQGPRRVTESGE